MHLEYTAVFLAALIPLWALRICYTLYNRPQSTVKRNEGSLAIFLGSGGHTAEMIRLLVQLDPKLWMQRTYLISSGDALSEAKALELERYYSIGLPSIMHVPRARRVHQSFYTAPITTLISIAWCFLHIVIVPIWQRRKFADLLVLNGPGTCVPIALCCVLLKVCALPSPTIIYVESFARVSSLSLSGKLLRPFVDSFIVQWPDLASRLNERTSLLQPKVECKRFFL